MAEQLAAHSSELEAFDSLALEAWDKLRLPHDCPYRLPPTLELWKYGDFAAALEEVANFHASEPTCTADDCCAPFGRPQHCGAFIYGIIVPLHCRPQWASSRECTHVI